MKLQSLILTFFLLLAHSFVNSQTYTWTNGIGNNLYSVSGNWSPARTLTTLSDKLIFDIGGVVVIDNTSSETVGEIYITNSTQLTLNATSGAYFSIGTNLTIDAGSELSFSQVAGPMILTIVSGGTCDIYGKLSFDGADHKLLAYDNESAHFYSGSTFIAGSNYYSAPFDLGETNSSHGIIFEDGSTYEHYGGYSPFDGIFSSIPIVIFNKLSNYKIYNDGMFVEFTGRKYGNITNAFPNTVTVDQMEAALGDLIFEFNNFYGESSSDFYYIGDGGTGAGIKINGNIETTGGGLLHLRADAQGIQFTGGAVHLVGGPGSVILETRGMSTGLFSFINAGNKLSLVNDIEIISSSADVFAIDGILDCDVHKVLVTSGSINVRADASVYTKRTDGIVGSIGNIQYSTSSEFVFNGTTSQKTGFSGFTSNLGKITIDNTAGVLLDASVTISGTLKLTSGTFDIASNNLILGGDIIYTSGKLAGDINNSILTLKYPSASTELKIPLAIQRLTIDIGSANAVNLSLSSAANGTELLVNQVTITSGDLKLNGQTLNITGSLTVSQNGKFLPDEISTVNVSGSSGNLEFPGNELIIGNLIVSRPLGVTLGNKTTIVKKLELNTSNIVLGEKELVIKGDYISNTSTISGDLLSILNVESSGNISALTFFPGKELLNQFSLNYSGSSKITLGSNLALNTLDFTKGKLYLETFNLTFDKILNANSSNYVVTNSTGYLIKTVNPGTLTMFEAGTENYYTPVGINPTSSSSYSIRCLSGTFSAGLSGNPLTSTQNVNVTWEISNSTSTKADISLYWVEQSEQADFNRTSCFASKYTSNQWEVNNTSPATGTSALWSVLKSGQTTYGAFMVSSDDSQAPTSSDKNIYSKKNMIYSFKSADFPFKDNNAGDKLTELTVTSGNKKGTLFFDLNENNAAESSEIVVIDTPVDASKINLLKFIPETDQLGIAYDYFKFKVSDGTLYSVKDYILTINIIENTELSGNEISENQPSDTYIGSFSINNLTGNNSYKLASGDGTNDTGNSSFYIKGTNLYSSVTFDYETVNSYNIYVELTNTSAGTFGEEFVITILDANDVPEAESQIFEVEEETPAGTVVATIEATDIDNNEMTFIFTEGDLNTFDVNEKTGEIFVVNSEKLVYWSNPEFIYKVEITDNGDPIMSSEAEIKILLTEKIKPDIVIANYFSPNGDGYNDYWEIQNIDPKEKIKMTVLNESGRVIFTSDDPDNKWDGKAGSNLQPDGIYYYVVQYKQFKLSGTITLMR